MVLAHDRILVREVSLRAMVAVGPQLARHIGVDLTGWTCSNPSLHRLTGAPGMRLLRSANYGYK